MYAAENFKKSNYNILFSFSLLTLFHRTEKQQQHQKKDQYGKIEEIWAFALDSDVEFVDVPWVSIIEYLKIYS